MSDQAKDKFRILVIDDNEAIHNDLKRILCAGGDDSGFLRDLEMELFGDTKDKITDSQFDLKCALQGKEGFEYAKEAVMQNEHFALAFVDVRMPPGWDGIETIAHIREEDKEMQVVVCTAYSDYSSDEIIAKVGSADNLFILKKPFDNVEILQMASALTKKWALNRELQGRMSDLESLVKERTLELEQANEELRRQLKEREQLQAERQIDRSLKAVGQLAEGITQEITQPVQSLADGFQLLHDVYGKIVSQFDAVRKLYDAKNDDLKKGIEEVKEAEKKNNLTSSVESLQKSFTQIGQDLGHVQSVVQAAVEIAQAVQDTMVQADLNKMLSNALILTRYQYKQIADVQIDLGEIPRILCNESQINQVFVNLLSNAAQAMADSYEETQVKKAIKVSSMQEGDQIVVAIQDQGKGIPEGLKEIYEQILSDEDLGKYAGQGLALARSIIVNGHQGRIDFESQENQGTSITIRLPLDPNKHTPVTKD